MLNLSNDSRVIKNYFYHNLSILNGYEELEIDDTDP